MSSNVPSESAEREPALALLPVRQAWRSAVTSAILNAVGMPIDLVVGRNLPDLPRWAPVVSVVVGVVSLIVLLVRRNAPTRALGNTAFLANTVGVSFALWMTSPVYASSELAWTPFQANKAAILVVAMLAPEAWVGLLSIVVYAGTAIMRFGMLDAATQQRLNIGEPWVVVAFAFIGCVLLGYRLRSLAFERRLLRAHAEAAALDRVAKTFLAVRDLANTPLQIIEFSAGLLRRRSTVSPETLARLDRALDRLHALNRLLSDEESRASWPGEPAEGLPIPEKR